MTQSSAFGVTIDITPDHPLPLFGFGGRDENFGSVRHGLEANVLGICPADTPPLYLVAIDALYGGLIGPQLRLRLGLGPDQLVVLGSHTHFAPGVDPGLPGLGRTDPTYVDAVVDTIATAIEGAQHEPRPTLAAGTAASPDLFVNRRRPAMGVGLPLPRLGRILLAPHPKGGVDPTTRVATVESGGRIVALLWGASCHPVCSPESSAVSPCFPGEVRDRLRGHVGEDVPILFCQGFSGDVRPASHTRRPPKQAKALLHYVAAGCRRFEPQSEEVYGAWCDELAETTLAALADLDSGVREELVGSVHGVEPDPIDGWQRLPHLKLIRLSKALSVLSVNAEVVHERIDDLEQSVPGLTIPAGCCDEVIGYWPTDVMLREGGYESKGSAHLFARLDWNAVGGPDSLWNDLFQKVLASVVTAFEEDRRDRLP